MTKPLISAATRRAFREAASGWGGLVVRIIDNIWHDEGFARSDDDGGQSGERRSAYQAYLNNVLWHDPAHVQRALHAFESTIRAVKLPPYVDEDTWFFELRDLLDRDGYTLDDRARIRPHANKVLNLSTHQLEDPSAIHLALDRITANLSTDPYVAIGTARELVESTAKIILREIGEAFTDRDDIADLIRRSQRALHLHPNQATPGPDGSDAVKKILGGLTSVVTGVAELRNRGFGAGHGPVTRPTGLGVRHARLAVTAATAWCQLMLDTLADPNAPWRTATEAATGPKGPAQVAPAAGGAPGSQDLNQRPAPARRV